MNLILCCDDQKSSDDIISRLNRLCDMTVVSYNIISDFLSQINDSPGAIMMIAQSGTCGTETAMQARERNPKGKLIWFSDLDFSLISFRLKATYFGLIPIEDDKLKIALGYSGVPLKNEKYHVDNLTDVYENRTENTTNQ